MSIVPSELVRALYDTPAFRGSKTGGQRGRWWSSTPEEANEYTWGYSHGGATDQYPEGAAMIPGQLNTREFGVVNARGKNYASLHLDDIRDPELRAAVRRHIAPNYNEPITTDVIAEVAAYEGLPGVTFNNIRDESPNTHSQYYVADPTRRRSRFARFENPNSEDLMASLLLSLMGGGAGAAALSSGDPNGRDG